MVKIYGSFKKIAKNVTCQVSMDSALVQLGLYPTINVLIGSQQLAALYNLIPSKYINSI